MNKHPEIGEAGLRTGEFYCKPVTEANHALAFIWPKISVFDTS